MSASFILPNPWYSLTIVPGATLDLPGLYEWQISGVGSYIGKFTSASRPTQAYSRNVQNILNQQPYRPSNPNGFRRIHRELAAAVRTGRAIRLIILENPPRSEINRRERELIAERGQMNG